MRIAGFVLAWLAVGLATRGWEARAQQWPAPESQNPPNPNSPAAVYQLYSAAVPAPGPAALPGPETSGPVPTGQQPAMQQGPGNMPPTVDAAGLPLPPQQPLPAGPQQPQFVTPGMIAPKVVEPPPKIWEGSLLFGLDGTSGNSQTLNFHFGSKLKRKTPENVFTAEIDYQRTSNKSVETANSGLEEARAEHLFLGSPWTVYIHETLDYNQFRAYHLRASADAGLGYQFIKNDAASLIGRVGAGTTRSFGNGSDEFFPELVLETEGELKLSKWQKANGSVEYRADVTELDNYRVTTKLGWEVLLDEDRHLSLKLGLLDRYDSNAGTKKPNDLNYAATLMWGF